MPNSVLFIVFLLSKLLVRFIQQMLLPEKHHVGRINNTARYPVGIMQVKHGLKLFLKIRKRLVVLHYLRQNSIPDTNEININILILLQHLVSSS